MASRIDRRELLRRAALAGAGAVIPASLGVRRAGAAPATAPLGGPAGSVLAEQEAAALWAFVDRLVPSDGNGPGAVEVGALEYIERALEGELDHHLAAYRSGLKATDAYALSRFGKRLPELGAEQQDDVLLALEAGSVPGFAAGSSSGTFFSLVREHVIEGMFGDPYYGGNVGFAGWDLIGYPGVKISGVAPSEQSLGVVLQPVHRSAYDYPIFKAPSGRVNDDG